MKDSDRARKHYRAVGPAVLRHARGVAVTVIDVGAHPIGTRHIVTVQDLDALAEAGGVGLAVPTHQGGAGATDQGGASATDSTHSTHTTHTTHTTDSTHSTGTTGPTGRTDPTGSSVAGKRVAWWIRPGSGADIAVAATAALALSEDPEGAGARWVPMSDGADGLVLVAVWPPAGAGEPAHGAAPPDAAAFAAAAARRLARRAPEIATTDPDAADGRAFIDARPSGPGGTIPVPYSLVPPGTDHAVVPLTLDELAAITAGMPADFEAGDLPDRLALHGDLAGPLVTGTPDG